jgi:chloramphenicol O-acetyltransferase type A
MRTIDLSTWPRRRHFEFFKAFDYPHFNLCAPVELGRFYPWVKERDWSFNLALVYLLTKAANAIPEFRYRIRGAQVIEHEVVHPSSTILADNDLFSFCTLTLVDPFTAFAAQAAELMPQLQQQPSLDDGGRDDLLFMTSLPWLAFTSMMHPIHMHPVDSVPRLAWGKFVSEGGGLKLPLSVQGHHGLMDGLHVGRFFAQTQAYLDLPETLFDVPNPKPAGQHPKPRM